MNMKLSELIGNNDPRLKDLKDCLDKFSVSKDVRYYYVYEELLTELLRKHNITNDIYVDNRNSL